ncbi:hypothetical protein ACOME3_007387 [Neoechinorhynchus agilis]
MSVQQVSKKVIEYIGRKGSYNGRTLTDYCLMLKDGGIGRIFILGSEERAYPEVSYYVLKTSQPSTDQSIKSSYFEAERVFRGERISNGENVYVHYRCDWHLVPVEDEFHYKQKVLPEGASRQRPSQNLEKFTRPPGMIGQILLNRLKKVVSSEKTIDDVKIPNQVRSSYVKLDD